MSKRTELVKGFYQKFDEDTRLTKSRQGQLEYRVTMDYIHRYLKKGASVIEIGAATGRYSIALAKEGFDVTSVELVEENLNILKDHGKGLDNLHAFQGDALDLSRFADNTFDVTLLFGPMYHLYNSEDQHKAISEAVRVTKKNGIILVAFLSVHSILMTNYLFKWGTFTEGYKENFNEDNSIKHFPEQMFTGFDIVEFEDLFKEHSVEYITTAAVDNVLEIAERRADFTLADEDFETLVRYQLDNCEKRELLGSSTHLLYICKKA